MCRMDKMNETFVQSCRFHSCGSGPFLSNYSIIKSVMERKKEGKNTHCTGKQPGNVTKCDMNTGRLPVLR